MKINNQIYSQSFKGYGHAKPIGTTTLVETTPAQDKKLISLCDQFRPYGFAASIKNKTLKQKIIAFYEKIMQTDLSGYKDIHLIRTFERNGTQAVVINLLNSEEKKLSLEVVLKGLRKSD
jgi:hypothetical protein